MYLGEYTKSNSNQQLPNWLSSPKIVIKLVEIERKDLKPHYAVLPPQYQLIVRPSSYHHSPSNMVDWISSPYPHVPPFLQPQVEAQEQVPPPLVHVQPPMLYSLDCVRRLERFCVGSDALFIADDIGKIVKVEGRDEEILVPICIRGFDARFQLIIGTLKVSCKRIKNGLQLMACSVMKPSQICSTLGTYSLSYPLRYVKIIIYQKCRSHDIAHTIPLSI